MGYKILGWLQIAIGVFAMVFLVACTVSQDIVCDSPYMRFGASCCLDQNNNTLCDADEHNTPVADTAVNNSKIVDANVQEENITDAIPPVNTPPAINPSVEVNSSITLSFTEQCEHDFLAMNKTYMYFGNKKEYGDVWVVHMRDKIKYTSPDHLFEVRNGTVIPSAYLTPKWGEYNTPFINDMSERKIPVMNYLTYENGTYYGCYVNIGYYKRENCLTDNTTKQVPIIFDNVSFQPPDDPMDWLRKYDGKEPYLVKYNYTNKEDNLVRYVDEAYFNNSDGTYTKLIIQKHFRLPVEVDIIGSDKIVKQRIVFKYMTVDLTEMKKWAPWFFES